MSLRSQSSRESARAEILAGDVQSHAHGGDGRVRVETTTNEQLVGRLYRVGPEGISVMPPAARKSVVLPVAKLRSIEGWVPRNDRLALVAALGIGAGVAIGVLVARGTNPPGDVRRGAMLGAMLGAIGGAMIAWLLQDLPWFGRWTVLLPALDTETALALDEALDESLADAPVAPPSTAAPTTSLHGESPAPEARS